MGIAIRIGLATAALAGVTAAWPATAESEASSATYDRAVLSGPVSPDPALDAFVATAGETFRNWSMGHFDEEKLRAAEAAFDDDVVLYVGGRELGEPAAFRHAGRYPREEILQRIGRLRADGRISPRRAANDGVYIMERLLSVGAVGENAWLEGEVCTASFGRLSDAQMQSRIDRTGAPIADWVVALVSSDAAPFHRYHAGMDWERGELLLIDPDAPPIRSCCWTSVVGHDGAAAYVQTGFQNRPFISYLSDHVCFARRDGGWKISAIAVRAD